jgi:hypothetical protein
MFANGQFPEASARADYSTRIQRMEKSMYQFAGESSFGEGLSRAHLGKKSQKEISGYGTMGAFLEIRYS